MSIDLSDRAILITGGGGFLALEFARSLSRAGAVPVLPDIDLARAQANAEALDAEGLAATPLQTDVTEPAECSRLVEIVVERLGRLDGLINNAIDPSFDRNHDGDPYPAFGDYLLELWNLSLRVDVMAFLFSDAASYMAGSNVVIDRGWTAW